MSDRTASGTFFGPCKKVPDTFARVRIIGGAGERAMRPLGFSGPGGKSELHRARWWVTPTGRKARESATEIKPPMTRPRLGEGGHRQG